MNDRKVTGIGCFGKPTTLSRVFKKMVENYTLEQIERLPLLNGYPAESTEGAALLNALITGKNRCFPSGACEAASPMENKKITGFFLTLKDQKLNLSIFARGDRNVRQRYTASLDALTAVRIRRLN